MSGMGINIRDRRLADDKQKQLTQRIVDTQEEERRRVARELHDGISQILVGIRFALDLALRQLPKGNDQTKTGIENSRDGLGVAITEVRRISRDLRPAVLDDLGLGPALKALTTEFGKRTDIKVDFETVVFRNRLHEDAKTALFRVAQEALTNIERHANASKMSLRVFGHRKGATLRITDNGIGFGIPDKGGSGGLGMRNMQERVEHLGGTLTITSDANGTILEATVPLSNMLAPEEATR